MRYIINPFPAVRVNGKWWIFMPRAIKYHDKVKVLRRLIKDPLDCMLAMIEGNYELVFMVEMPKSWSQKKKDAMYWQPHRQTPDIDNLFKAFTDTLFYVPKWEESIYNDKEIYKIKARKYWSKEWEIEFNIL